MHFFSNNSLLLTVSVVVIGAFASNATAQTPNVDDIRATPFLGAMFEDRFIAGVAMDARETTGISRDLLLHHFGSITPENHMKPEEIQPSEGIFTFEAADAITKFARDNELQVYGHVLVWHSQTADWMFETADGEPLTESIAHQQILLDRMETHINAVADRYRDDVWAFDVVNEVIDESESDGYRKSRWFEVLGPDYIPQAFRMARAAFGPEVELFINDYSTEVPTKREAYYNLVSGLVAGGVPIDGVGHQLHIKLNTPISDIDASLTRFRDLGLVQAVTELDIALSSTNDEVLTQTPRDRLIRQGYYTRDLLAMLSTHADQIVSLTVWGLHDGRTWLRYWPQDRPFEAPLLFDDDLKPKPAFWGFADPSRLPHNPQGLTIPSMDVSVDGRIEAGWQAMPPVELAPAAGNAPATTFQMRWADGALFLLADVTDSSDTGGDAVEVFIDGFDYALPRTGIATQGVDLVAAETAHGYRIEARFNAETASASTIFDLRVMNGAGNTLSWSDQSHTQSDTLTRQGILTLRDSIRSVQMPATATAPVIDGLIDDLWLTATLTTDVLVSGDDNGAQGTFAVIWDDTHIYVLGTVNDGTLDATSISPWEHDSIEVFISPGNERAGGYAPADGQYRINFENTVTVVRGTDTSPDTVTSATTLIDGGYRVEVAIAVEGLRTGAFIGFDLQVNDAANGARSSVHTWQDETGDSYRDTRNWGMAALGAN